MSRSHRPLEPHEISYLLVRRIEPATVAPRPELSDEEWADALLHTPMGCDPVEYAPFLRLMRTPVGARA